MAIRFIAAKKPITIDRGENRKLKVSVEVPQPVSLDEMIDWAGGKDAFFKWSLAKVKTDAKNAGRNKGNAASETATDEMVTKDVQAEVKGWVIGRDRANSGRVARDNNAKAIAALENAKKTGQALSAEELLALLTGAGDSDEE